MNRLLAVLLLGICSLHSFGQDDLMSLLNESEESGDEVVSATFKSTRLINGHTIETRPQGVLEFVISHRFAPVNTGVDGFWGLDGANIRLGLEYGLIDKLNVGIGRSSFNQVVDLFGKYKLLAQSSSVPITTTLFASIARRTDNFFENQVGEIYEGYHRFAYTYQALIARKMNNDLSLQLSPTLVHRNYVQTLDEPNDLIVVGIGGRYKITNRVTLNAEYWPTINQESDRYHDAFAIGVDLETGGHVFQLHFTNAQQINEKGFLGETTSDFLDGGIHFGFNVSRVFNVAVKQ